MSVKQVFTQLYEIKGNGFVQGWQLKPNSTVNISSYLLLDRDLKLCHQYHMSGNRRPDAGTYILCMGESC